MSEPVFEALCVAFDQLSVAVLILSASGRILFANQAASAMLEEGWPIRLLDGCLQGKDRGVSAALKQTIEFVSLNQQG
ncbi:MAG TPA: PAS domain-containing protein, partial [Geobacterales bacterium]|nr:PAS domain-containing protein [Geobacterales bacterium]